MRHHGPTERWIEIAAIEEAVAAAIEALTAMEESKIVFHKEHERPKALGVSDENRRLARETAKVLSVLMQVKPNPKALDWASEWEWESLVTHVALPVIRTVARCAKVVPIPAGDPALRKVMRRVPSLFSPPHDDGPSVITGIGDHALIRDFFKAVTREVRRK